MTQRDEGQRRRYIRQYFRSLYFQILSWLCLALTVGSFFVSNYRLWLLYAAAAIAFTATVPVLKTIPNQNIDLKKKNERMTLLVIFIYIAAIILGVLIYGLYRTSH